MAGIKLFNVGLMGEGITERIISAIVKSICEKLKGQ